MSIIKCKECGKDVSTKAKECPNCGARVKYTSNKKIGCLSVVIGFIIFLFIVMSRDGDSNYRPTITDECRAELQCYAENKSYLADALCQKEIEKLAKHQSRWTDKTLEEKFTRYRWGDNERKAITFIGDKIQFQNGFGAWVNMVYECSIDPVAEMVLGVKATEGRI